VQDLPYHIDQAATEALRAREVAGYLLAMRGAKWLVSLASLTAAALAVWAQAATLAAFALALAICCLRLKASKWSFGPRGGHELSDLLAAATPSDARRLSPSCRTNLVEVLRSCSIRSTSDIDALLAIRIIKSLTLAGESRALLHIGWLARGEAGSKDERRIRLAARRSVSIWLRRLERTRRHDPLLRPAAAEPGLLRPIHAAGGGSLHLRPAESASH
jgi:hypothetical protein